MFCLPLLICHYSFVLFDLFQEKLADKLAIILPGILVDLLVDIHVDILGDILEQLGVEILNHTLLDT